MQQWVSKEWSMVVVKTPLELLRRLSEYIMEHTFPHPSFALACQYKPINDGNLFCDCPAYSPIHIAALHGDIDLIKHIELRNKYQHPPNCTGRTPLHLAAFQGHLEICKWYIMNTKEVNTEDYIGWTALHLAASNGQVEIFKYLLENGADLNLKSDLYIRDTPLHVATMNGHTDIVKFILVNVVDKNPVNVNRQTPLSLAANNGSLEIYRLICPYVDDPVPLNLKMSWFKNVTSQEISIYFRFMQRAQLAQFEGNPAFSPGF